MESSTLVLALGLTAFLLLVQHKAQAGNEDLSQKEKINQLAEAVLKLQEKTTTLEVEVKTLKQNQEEDAKKFNDIISKQQTEIKVLQEEMSICQEQRSDTELEIKEYKEESMFAIEEQNNKMSTLQKDLITMNRTVVENDANMKVLRDAPESFACGYQDSWNATHSTITYDSIFYERSNQPTGGLDIGSGVFTAPYPGTYTVTWTLNSDNGKGISAALYLYRNGDRVDESYHYTKLEPYYGVFQSGNEADKGGVTLMMYLDMGEEISLHYTGGDAHVLNVMFCVQMVQFDA